MEDGVVFRGHAGRAARRAWPVARRAARPADPAHPGGGQELLRPLRLPGRLDAADLRRGGMSPGALYRYFPSKESIIEAICEADRQRGCRDLRGDAENAVASSMASSRRAMAHIALSRMRTAMRRSSPRSRAESLRNDAIRRDRRRLHGRGSRTCSAPIFSGAIERGEIDPVGRPRRAAADDHGDRRGAGDQRPAGRGVPLDKLETMLRAIDRRHAAADRRRSARANDRITVTIPEMPMTRSQNPPNAAALRLCLAGATLLAAMPADVLAAEDADGASRAGAARHPRRRGREARTGRDAVGQRHDRGARGGGRRHRPQRPDRDRAQRRRGRHGQEGRRAGRARPLDARHAACADGGEPRPGRGQHRADAGADRRCRGRRAAGRGGARARRGAAAEGRCHRGAARQCRQCAGQRAGQARLGREGAGRRAGAARA